MAVNPDQFPTTVEFFKRLPQSITDYPLFRQIFDYIKNQSGSDRIDIEQVLWELEELRKSLRGLRDRSSIAGYCLDRKNSRHTAGDISFGQLDNGLKAIIQHTEWLSSEINKLEYDLYSYDPVESELSSNWIALISDAWNASGQFNIFTTNYDGVIESALGNSEIQQVELDRYLGYAGARKKHIDLDVWKNLPVESKGLLTKLHGSVDWKRNGNRINISDSGFSGDHGRHPIIYPGFKGTDSSEFFDAFHAHLESVAREADIAIFIGFAFRDDHINSIIRESISGSAKVFIVDINNKIRFPTNRIEPYRIPSFDTDGIKNIFQIANIGLFENGPSRKRKASL